MVSIIIPVYNTGKYLKTCMESLLNQTYQDIEIICVNDGSTDESESVILDYAKRDARIIYVSKQNEGVSKARNVGMDIARGQYLMFVDADDWLAETCIEHGMKQVEKNRLDMVLGGTVMVYNSHTKRCVADTEAECLIYEKDLSEYIKKVLSNGNVGNSPLNTCFTSGPVCKLIRKDLIGDIRFCEELVIGEDTVFNLEVAKNLTKIGVMPQEWYFYRMNEVSVTKTYNPVVQKHTENMLEILMKMYGREKSLKPYLCERMIQQFYGMLLLGTLNKNAGLKFIEKVKHIRNMWKKELWKNMTGLCRVKELPFGSLDKVLLVLCKCRATVLVIWYVDLRRWMKYAVESRRANKKIKG